MVDEPWQDRLTQLRQDERIKRACLRALKVEQACCVSKGGKEELTIARAGSVFSPAMPKLALFAAAVALAAPAAEAARPGATAATLAAEHAPAAPPVLSGHFVAHVHEVRAEGASLSRVRETKHVSGPSVRRLRRLCFRATLLRTCTRPDREGTFPSRVRLCVRATPARPAQLPQTDGGCSLSGVESH